MGFCKADIGVLLKLKYVSEDKTQEKNFNNDEYIVFNTKNKPKIYMQRILHVTLSRE
jgi:hypothetical protein